MMYRGHMAAGVIMAPAAVGIACILSKGNIGVAKGVEMGLLAGVSSFSTSLIPDLDSGSSKISRKIPIVGLIRIGIAIFLLSRLIVVFRDGVSKLMDMSYLMHLFVQVAVAGFLMYSVSHRKLLHSAWPLLMISAAACSYIGFSDTVRAGISAGFIMGAASHLWGDMHTTDGCPLLYPLPIAFKVANFKSGKHDKLILFIICAECALAIAGTIFFIRGGS